MNPLSQCREGADARPEWAHLYTLELDQALQRRGALHLLTLSRHGSCSTQPGLAPTRLDDTPPDNQVIPRAAGLLAEGRRWEAMQQLYDGALGEAIHAANLLYANASLSADGPWLHFLNKYLARFDTAALGLRPGTQPRYQRLQAGQPAARPVRGPVVSVLMPARNAADTVEFACRSILAQTWSALELIVVDDASDDDTLERVRALAGEDSRVRVLALVQRAGPYVAKNHALSLATGRYLTCHDADDFALPDRLQRQMQPLLEDKNRKASIGRMLRLRADGQFTRFTTPGPLSHDGALRRAYVSPLMERAFFDRYLGAWDSVQFGADSELLGRLEHFVPGRVVDLVQPVLLALDTPDGLTRQGPSAIAEHGRLDGQRAAYHRAWTQWHAAHRHLPRLPFPQVPRAFPVPDALRVADAAQHQVPQAPAAIGAARPGVQLHALWRAAQRLDKEAPEQVLCEAEREASDAERPAIALARANQALHDDQAWLRQVNLYAGQFGGAALQLREGTAPRFWRLEASAPRHIERGPLVSVIMPAYNASASLAFSARSILAQTWRPLELIIVDDASADDTAAIAESLAREDPRVKVLRNRGNVGPYVAKNFGLQVAQGDYITGHDADDWAHPERIERQLQAVVASGPAMPANLVGMLRCEANGYFSRFSMVTENSRDGALQAAFISAFFEARFLRERLGHWDEARFAGDSEMIRRTQRVLGAELPRLHCLGMVCLDSPTGLTNHPDHGYSPTQGLSESRRRYRDAFAAWHMTLEGHNARLDFPQQGRRFAIPEAVRVDPAALAACLEGHAAVLQAAQRL